jgi:GNAT superfamily N-acetyltransferase
VLRPCTDADRPAILAIVNAGAEAYRGVIPADRWREPYMTGDELDAELASGVVFVGHATGDRLDGVMGIQRVRDVQLIRHAYVLPEAQGTGVGRTLLEHLVTTADAPLLVGTWRAASWAVRFYERNGFVCADAKRTKALLRTYWDIPERQVETSVVLERLG